MALAERIRSEVERTLSDYGVTTSIGVATFVGEIVPDAADGRAEDKASKEGAHLTDCSLSRSG